MRMMAMVWTGRIKVPKPVLRSEGRFAGICGYHGAPSISVCLSLNVFGAGARSTYHLRTIRRTNNSSAQQSTSPENAASGSLGCCFKTRIQWLLVAKVAEGQER
jgi:hypothetical protein